MNEKVCEQACCTPKQPRLGNPLGVAAFLKTPDLSFIPVESLEGGRRMMIRPLTLTLLGLG